MAIAKLLLAGALTCITALGIHAPIFAQQTDAKAEANATSEGAERATDTALLDALLKRRALVVQSAGTAESKRAALEFLDSRIAKLRRQLGR